MSAELKKDTNEELAMRHKAASRLMKTSKTTRSCPLADVDINSINYKNLDLLLKFVSENGRILPRRITSVSAKKQRKLKQAIRRARILALLPYSAN